MRRLAFLISLSVLLAGVFSAPAFADKRVALVVGNSAYRNVTRLDNPGNDAKLVADTPELFHGDTTENPRPAPSDSKTNVSAQAATAPATTAAQETPGIEDSAASSTTPTGCITCSINPPSILNSMKGKCWNGKKVPKQPFCWSAIRRGGQCRRKSEIAGLQCSGGGSPKRSGTRGLERRRPRGHGAFFLY